MNSEAVLQAYADAYVLSIQEQMAKVGLANSNLYKKTTGHVQGDNIEIRMPDYAQWVQSGRKPGVTKVPISALVAWIKDKGIQPASGQTVNSLAYAIQTSIYQKGIKGRKLINDVALQVVTERVSEQVFTTYFNSLQT